MRVLRAAAVRIRALLWRARTDAELAEELRYHLERDIERRMARGASADDARLAARRAFGNPTVMAEQARDASRIAWLEQIAQELRYAVRGLTHAPRFALTVVLTIGLGLGLVTTAFTIFNAYVLRPLEVREPRSLYEMELRDRQGRSRNVSPREYEALLQSNPAFRESFAYQWAIAWRNGEPLMLQTVSGNFFPMLGVPAALGRTIVAGDVTPQGSAVLVLSHRAWRTKFGGDSTVVGRRVLLRGRSFEIVGVAREGFDGLTDTPPDFWAPITMLGALDDRAVGSPDTLPLLKIVGRLKHGVTPEAAGRGLSAWAAALTSDARASQRVATVTLEPRATATYLSPQAMVAVSPIFVAFALVLVLACANVANMMLARGMARQRELGIRLALGAARARIVRQLLIESLLLAAPAALAGFAASRLALDVGVRVMFGTVPEVFGPYLRMVSLAPDGRLMVFVFVAALLAAVAFGLVPALQSTRTNIVGATRGEFTTAARPARIRSLLVVAQVTVCALLLVTAGVLVRGSDRLEHVDLGLRTTGVVLVTPPNALRDRVIERLRGEAVVAGVEATSAGPLDGRFWPVAVTGGSANVTVTAGLNHVSRGYFRALGISVVRGRLFTDEEARSGDPVAMVSASTARALWPAGHAVGAELRLHPSDDPGVAGRRVRVVGVVSDVVTGFVGEARDRPTVYEPIAVSAPGASLIVATRSDAARARRTIAASLAGIDPGGSTEMHTLEESVAVQVYPFRAAHWVASALGVLALLLTITGIYGVLAYIVEVRQREIGIRVALGATRRSVVGLIVRQSVRLAAVGTVVGATLAVGMARLIAAWFPIIPAFDAMALTGGVAVVLTAALVAAYGPARRAATADPVEALRR